MKYRKLGKTDLELSEVGFGVWTLSTSGWGRLDERESMALLSQALDMGISFFDTADVYGEGYGEEILAKALGKQRNSIVIGTKVGYDFYTHEGTPGQQEHPQDFSPPYVRYACEQSLRRLRTDYIDLYQLHNPPMTAIEGDDLFEMLESLVKEGKVRYYGCALGREDDWIEEGEASMKERRVSSVQMVYNILEQEQARKLLPIAEEVGTGLLVRDIHTSGMLNGIYDRSQAWPAASLKKMEGLDFLTQETDATLGQIAIKFALARKSIACALPNISSQERLKEFAFAPDTPDLTAETLERLDDLYNHNFNLEERP